MYFVLKILTILFALFSSTCFGHHCVHHQELLSSYNTAGLEDTTNQAQHGTRNCMCSWEAPDDGHNGVRNM